MSLCFNGPRKQFGNCFLGNSILVMNNRLKYSYVAAFLSSVITLFASPSMISRFCPHSLDEYPQLIAAEIERWKPISVESLDGHCPHEGVVDNLGNWIIPPKYCFVFHDPKLDVYWVSSGHVKSPTDLVVFNHRFALPQRYDWQCLDRNGRKIDLPLPIWATNGLIGKPTTDEALPNGCVGEILEPSPPWLLKKTNARGHYVGHNLWAVRFDTSASNKIDWFKQSRDDLYDLDLQHLTALVDQNGKKVATIPGGCSSWTFAD